MSADKKIWTWQGSLQDHVRFLVNLPFFFVAPLLLTPKAVETVHLSVNSINRCNFCTGLHCEIGRMAGLKDVNTVNECAKLVSEEENVELGIFSKYGAAFGKYNGRGEVVDDLFNTITSEKGFMIARSVQGLAFFLMWGSISGNTLISFYRGTLRGNMREGSNIYFEVLFALYYSVLFAVITAVSKLLSFFPSGVPSIVNIAIGLVLPLTASFWIVPYALLGLICTPFLQKSHYDPLGGEYDAVV